MSFLGKIGKVLKKAAPVIGMVAGNALLPGVGGALGGAVGGGISRAGKGRSVGDVLGGAALGGATGIAANTLSAGKGFSGSGLLQGAKGLLTGRGPAQQNLPPAPAGAHWGTDAQGRPQLLPGAGAPPSGGGLLNGVKDFIFKNPGTAAGLGLGAANLISSGKKAGQADAMRAASLDRMKAIKRVPLDDLYASSNPYRRVA